MDSLEDKIVMIIIPCQEMDVILIVLWSMDGSVLSLILQSVLLTVEMDFE